MEFIRDKPQPRRTRHQVAGGIPGPLDPVSLMGSCSEFGPISACQDPGSFPAGTSRVDPAWVRAAVADSTIRGLNATTIFCALKLLDTV